MIHQPTSAGTPVFPTSRRIARFKLASIVSLALLLVASVIMLAPLVFTISTSLRTPIESFSLPPRWFPAHPAWDNYRTVFSTVPLKTYFLNSTVVTLCIVLGQLMTSAMAGYAFARLDFPGRNVIFWLVLSTLMIPLQATIIPVFVLISKVGLSDTLASLILPALASAFGTFLMRQYFLQIPIDFEEAALIDGASQWEIFRSIYLPLAKGGLAVLAVLTFNGYWNEFLRPLIFLKTADHFTLPVGLVNLQGYMGTGSVSVVLAGVVISLLPVFIIYLIGQRYLVEGLMIGGLKG